MVKCCITECKSQKYPGCAMTFHGFPSDESLKRKWIEATDVTGNVKYKRICPLHFRDEDFMIKGKVIRLKPNIVPSLCEPPFRKYDENKIIFKSSKIECTSMNDKMDYGKNNLNGNIWTHADNNRSPDNFSEDLGTQETKATATIARCKCCLESDRLLSMWQEHSSEGLREVYGVMLTECFALHWNRPQNPANSPDLICESCIKRLRDAVNFKTEVLASEQLLSGQLEAVDVDKLKQERDDLVVNIQTEYLDYEDLHNDDNDEVDVSFDDNDGVVDDDMNNFDKDTEGDIGIAVKSEPYSASNETQIYKEPSRRRQIKMAFRKQSTRSSEVAEGRRNGASKRFKMSRRMTSNALKHEVELIPPIRKHVNVSDNLRKAVEAVRSRRMSEAVAAMTYNVPLEAIGKEIRRTEVSDCKENDEESKNNVKNGVVFIEIQQIKGDTKEGSNNVKEELLSRKTGSRVKEKGLGSEIPSENRLAEMKKQANNIAIILECTNATPIRRHGGIGYGCCFCNEEFPDAADLKQHTIKEHDVKTKRNYAKGKRPSAYLVKLDITDLKCNLCGNNIDSLEQLYDHLIETHKKLLYRNAKNYIVPFKFDQEELRCLFCEYICNSFKGLLEHMSVHYPNHICEICNTGFLTKNNLFNHAGRHKKGTFKCDFCPKVFDTSSKKAGHQRLVHSSTNGVNRCGYCGEMFGTYRRKEKHLINEHGVTLKKLKCKACDKTFETQTALRIHTKRDHLVERRFQCTVCDKRCFTNVQLNQHILKHTGIKKFQCTVCLKAYGRKSTLREHMRIHENDRRFKCELCGMAFVQKCSWRGHMLSKHGQQV